MKIAIDIREAAGPKVGKGWYTFVMVKELSDGSRAVGLFNTCEVEVLVKVTWTELEVKGKQRVRDLWRQKDLGGYNNEFERTVPRHGVELIRLWPQP